VLRLPRRHLLEPNDRLDGFDLTEEQRRLCLARAPVIEQPRRLVGHTRLPNGQVSPALEMTADLVDQCVFGGLLGEGKALLPRSPRLRNRHQVFAAAPARLDYRSKRAALVQSPVAARRRKR
jgi:hypothetical protein